MGVVLRYFRAGLRATVRRGIELSAVSVALQHRRVPAPPRPEGAGAVPLLDHRLCPRVGRARGELPLAVAQLQLCCRPPVVCLHARGHLSAHADALAVGRARRQARVAVLSAAVLRHHAHSLRPRASCRRCRTRHLWSYGHSQPHTLSALGRGQLEHLRPVLLSQWLHRLSALGALPASLRRQPLVGQDPGRGTAGMAGGLCHLLRRLHRDGHERCCRTVPH